MSPRHIAVIDIGKTNAKLALVDGESLAEIAVVTQPNTVLPGPPYPHFDLEGHWQFLLSALRDFHAAHGIDAISVTTHGASAVMLDENGALAAPMLDYEHDGPDEMAAAYDAIRPGFAETGAPRLPIGLNLGAQLYWQFARDPGLLARCAHIVTYPQYWGFRLTGALASDVSSLGCHTDLWAPREGAFSTLVARLSIAGKIAPARPSADVLGRLLPKIAASTGLPEATPVHVGIHDSNASLLPHIMGRAAPFSVISSGTWVIAMAVGGQDRALDPGRDTLMNVNAMGAPVPSARFMGGREFDLAMEGPAPGPRADDIAEVLAGAIMLLPSLAPQSGPYQGRRAKWCGAAPAPGTGQRMAAVSFYLALVSARCLSLIGHRGTVVVEGPFARNATYLRMLSAAADCPVEAARGSTGTSQGAALLAGAALPVLEAGARFEPGADAQWAEYAARWRAAVEPGWAT